VVARKQQVAAESHPIEPLRVTVVGTHKSGP